MKNRISIYSFMTCLGIVLMILSDLLVNVGPGFLGYIDEMVTVVCLLLIGKKLIEGKIRVWIYYGFLIGVVLIGLLGNVVWGVQPKLSIAFTDLFLFIKPYIIMLYFHITLNEYRADKIYKSMMQIAKLLIIIMAVFSIVTLIVPLGMRTERGSYQFLGGFSGGTSWWTILFCAVISSNPENHRTFYYLLSALIIIQSGSGLGILALALAVLIYFFIEVQKKFHWYYLLLIIPLCLFVGKNEIIEYLLNTNAPRHLLFYYAFITANTFFPLGAGFATYGSTTAISNYSKLYDMYGFERRWGMSRDFHPFLMDSYFPQIIGQFGYIGSFLYACFIFVMIQKFIFKIADKNCMCSCLYLFICWLIAGFGFGTASSWGCTVYLLLPILRLSRMNEEAKT